MPRQCFGVGVGFGGAAAEGVAVGGAVGVGATVTGAVFGGDVGVGVGAAEGDGVEVVEAAVLVSVGRPASVAGAGDGVNSGAAPPAGGVGETWTPEPPSALTVANTTMMSDEHSPCRNGPRLPADAAGRPLVGGTATSMAMPASGVSSSSSTNSPTGSRFGRGIGKPLGDIGREPRPALVAPRGAKECRASHLDVAAEHGRTGGPVARILGEPADHQRPGDHRHRLARQRALGVLHAQTGEVRAQVRRVAGERVDEHPGRCVEVGRDGVRTAGPQLRRHVLRRPRAPPVAQRRCGNAGVAKDRRAAGVER